MGGGIIAVRVEADDVRAEEIDVIKPVRCSKAGDIIGLHPLMLSGGEGKIGQQNVYAAGAALFGDASEIAYASVIRRYVKRLGRWCGHGGHGDANA